MDHDSLFQWLRGRLPNAQIARIELDSDQLTIYTGRPGIVIGKNASTIEALHRELEAMGVPARLHICELRRIELEPLLVADSLVGKLEAEVEPESAIVRTAQLVTRAGARSIWIHVSGALQLTHEEHGEPGPGERRSAVREGQVAGGAIRCEVELLVPS
jgi:small subunit ribosomal protein S3